MILVTHDIDEAVYLGDRVVVLSSRPGEIRQDIKVELARPRDRTSDDFALIRRRVYREFFKDSSSQPEYFL
jgi:sulfonate transport system ATP-binding protein